MFSDSAGAFTDGWLLFLRQGTLLAQQLDTSRMANPITVAGPIGESAPLNRSAFSASDSGVVAYRSVVSVPRQLNWYDCSGKRLGAAAVSDLNDPELSRDGSRIAGDR